MYPILLGTYDIFKTSNKFHAKHTYFELYQDIAYGGASAWVVTFKIAVFAAVVAVVNLGLNYILNSSTVQERLQLKKDTQRVITVSVLIFSIVSLVTFVTKIALDW